MSRHLYMPDAKLTDIIEDWAWCESKFLGPKSGTRIIAPDGFVFLSLLSCSPLSSIRDKGSATWFLYVKPTEPALKEAAWGCGSGELNSLKFCRQLNDPSKYLIVCRATSSVGQAWLTYITPDQLPTPEFIEAVKEYRP
jgi:hypothetical protein